MYGADEIIVLVQYRSGICRRRLGKRAGPSRSIYRVVTGGHTVGTPKQARGALSIPFPRYSYKRCRRSHAQAGPCTLGRLNPFTVQSREVMPSALLGTSMSSRKGYDTSEAVLDADMTSAAFLPSARPDGSEQLGRRHLSRPASAARAEWYTRHSASPWQRRNDNVVTPGNRVQTTCHAGAGAGVGQPGSVATPRGELASTTGTVSAKYRLSPGLKDPGRLLGLSSLPVPTFLTGEREMPRLLVTLPIRSEIGGREKSELGRDNALLSSREDIGHSARIIGHGQRTTPEPVSNIKPRRTAPLPHDRDPHGFTEKPIQSNRRKTYPVQEVNIQLNCGYQKADHTGPPQSPG
ncbi:hypothetical protein Bbelb_433690 [Branchiostoma belcheri]|nr:hypothetical protein Bbelb_433690 [Branchiostoma belcheri]